MPLHWSRRASSAGKISRAALEYSLTDHCNLTCVGCDHASPLLPPRFADLDGFRADASALAAALRVRELRFVGGEPLLHPSLFAFLDAARASNLAESITLITNGVLLHRFGDALYERIDTLWISRYPGVRLKVDLACVRGLTRQHGVALQIRQVTRFRHTLLTGRHTDAGLVGRIYRDCDLAHRWSCHAFQDGYYFKCSPAPVLAARLARDGATIPEHDGDGVRIRGNGDLRRDLETYLADDRPLRACEYCLGTSGRTFAHAQMGARRRGEPAPAETASLLTPRPLRFLRKSAQVMADALIRS